MAGDTMKSSGCNWHLTFSLIPWGFSVWR